MDPLGAFDRGPSGELGSGSRPRSSRLLRIRGLGWAVHVEQRSLQAAAATVEGPIMTGCMEAGADLLTVDDLVSLVNRRRKFD
jgi:hypothetical protein